MTSPARPWAGQAPLYGAIGESQEWKLAQDEYYWDRLDRAMEIAESLGAGTGAQGLRIYRQIQAEFITRQASRIDKIAPWLQLETVPHEITPGDELRDLIIGECESVAKNLNYADRADTMVSFMAAETDAPWTEGRFGYMVDKYPYDKICLPLAAAFSREGLAEVVRHEYAHVVALNLSKGNIGHWVQEMVATTLQGSYDSDSNGGFPMNAWMNPAELETAFGWSDPRRRLAYRQASILGKYLVGITGLGGLGDLLRALGNNSTWTELRMALTGQSHEDEALREAYGFGVKELFDKARPQ